MTSMRVYRLISRLIPPMVMMSTLSGFLLLSGCGGAHFNAVPAATVNITASPSSIAAGGSSTLTVSASNATSVSVSGTDGSSYTMSGSGGTQSVSPAKTTTYTATATGLQGVVTATMMLSVSSVTPPPAAVLPTVSITASPTSIVAGSASTLTVAATNATSVVITGTDGSSYTLQPTGGTQSVSPAASTTYTATATGAGGKATAVTALTVTQPSAPPAVPTVVISAAPASIVAGSASVLTITATNATGVTVTGTDGSTFALKANGGTQSVSPTATTTYTASATGAGGSATASTKVTVTAAGVPLPTVSISANPTSITAGNTSTLTVSATNATAVTVSGTDGSAYTLQANGGTQAITPATTTTYTATATGAGGTASATTIVTVTAVSVPVPTVTLTANPASLIAGNASTLTATATNATGVIITGSDGTTYALAASGGSQSVSPLSTTTYTATATGAGGSATASTLVTVTPAGVPPPVAATVSIVATPTSIVAGGSSSLTVVAANATTVVITGSDGSTYALGATGGTAAVKPTVTTTYTATASGAGASATATALVTVTPAAAATVSIAAKPASIVSGGSSTLTVIAANATTVTVAGSDGSTYTLAATGGTAAVNPTVTTTYTATASGAGASATAATTVTVTASPAATVTIVANPASVVAGTASTLTVVATNATTVNIAGSDGTSYALPAAGGTQSVTPTATTTYTVTASGAGASATAAAVVTVTPAGSVQSINHVVFMLQENHTFDNYFGMLNTYRQAQTWTQGDDGVTYTVDGIEDKLKTISNLDDSGNSFKLFPLASTCIDDDSSAWLASYGDANRYDFLNTRPIKMDGFVHTAGGFAQSCAQGTSCSGDFTDLNGQRAMGYYDDKFLNYYYYMASQFAVSNRWFSPIASESVDNRIATFTGGTTQGITVDPGGDDHLPQLGIPTIFSKLQNANVSWKIYYTVTQGFCLADLDDCGTSQSDRYPATDFSELSDSYSYLYENPSHAACTGTTVQSKTAVGDSTNSYCVDPNHIAPLGQYFTDLTNGTLPSFAFIEAGYANNDEHPGSKQSILTGQYEMSTILNAFMTSPSWNDSVFFFGYDEGGGPYDHVPPVPGHSNDFTDASIKGSIPDIASIAVDADGFKPCVPTLEPATTHCDLHTDWPGAGDSDAPTVKGFAAQLGFRIPNMVVSPFTRRHYVSNIPMDHTAILRFVEDRFIGDHTYLTHRDAAQPNLLDFFDFNAVPWATPPTPPVPTTVQSLGYDPCNAANMQ